MMQWLVQYGVDRQKNFEVRMDDIDIHDKLQLEDQINVMRKNCKQLLALMDDIQGQLVDVKRKIALRVKDLTLESKKSGERLNALLAVDDQWIELDATRDALSAGLSLVQNELDQCRTDLRILNSSMYQKF